jgi:CubicO group peptidase (beta-lactamase class C family)
VQRVAENLRGVLEEALSATRTPGGALGVFHDGRLFEASAGVASTVTGAPMTLDTMIPITCVTKIYTGALVLQLRDMGLLSLEAPWNGGFPGFSFPQLKDCNTATVEDLLTHRSGLCDVPRLRDISELDYWRIAGSLDRYLQSLDDDAILCKARGRVSHSDLGFVVLGALAEHVRGRNWHHALRAGIIEPLGLRNTVTSPDETIGREVAVGHVIESSGEARPVWPLRTPVSAPSSGVFSSVRDIIAFARMYLNGGQSGSGQPVISPRSIEQVCSTAIQADSCWRANVGQSLGWFVGFWGGAQMLWDCGAGDGVEILVVVSPAHDLCVAVVTNSDLGYMATYGVLHTAMRELVGVEVPELPTSAPTEVQGRSTSAYIGRYVNGRRVFDVYPRGKGLGLKELMATDAHLRRFRVLSETPLWPVDTNLFIGPKGNCRFDPVGSSGQSEGVHTLMRYAVRADDPHAS